MQSLAPMFGVVLLTVATAAGLIAATRGPEQDPVGDINHAIHIERDLECVDCHVGVEERASAGVPSVAICAECHDDPEDEMAGTPNGKHVLDHILRGEELWWPQLYELPDHVVFSHRRHVTLGEIDCKECHGDIASSTTLPEEPVEETLTMDGCMDCHERSGASLDCLACHR